MAHNTEIHFESYQAFVNGLDQPAHASNDLRGSSEEGSGGWAGTETYAEAMNLLRHGWPEGTAKLKKALAGTNLTITRLEPAFDVTGLGFDLDRVLAGEPEDMLYFMDTPDGQAKFVTVYVQLDYPSSRSASEVIKRGACVLSKIQQLELDGTRVKIVGYFRGQARNNKLQHTMVLKHFEHGLEIDRMAFALVHPSMCRRFFFRLAEQIEKDKYYSRAYGHAIALDSVPAGAVHVTHSHFSTGQIDQCFNLN